PEEGKKLSRFILALSIPVFVFGLAQFFVLPKDFLVRFGYSSEPSSVYQPDKPLPAYQLADGNILRVQSTFSGPNQLASFALFIFFLSLGLLAEEKKGKVLPFLTLFLSLALLVFTFSRSAWIGCLAGIVFLWIRWRRKFPLFVGLSLGAVLATGATLALKFSGKLKALLLRPSSSPWHWIRLKDAWGDFLKNIWGGGLGKVGPASQWLFKPYLSENYYLQVALEGGILALLAFVGAVVCLWWELSSKKALLSQAIAGFWLAILVSSFFLHTLGDGVLAIYLGMALALGQTNKAYV
ncbi:O-antigen ligase family protein, partial [bacterium]|nr:O-antigen ligase family protein [bacterium]